MYITKEEEIKHDGELNSGKQNAKGILPVPYLRGIGYKQGG
jgi:hypothetical protein